MSVNLQPTLTGNLLELRPLLAEDFEDLYAVASDPVLWEQHPARDRYQRPVFEKLFKESLASGGALVVVDLKDGKVIGSSRYHDYLPEPGEIEIGWSFLARSHWGGAYNREMKRLMLDHAFTFVDHVLFIVGVDNIRSQKAMEKIGGQRIGTRPDSRGNESYLYRISKP